MVKFIHAADLHLDSPFKGLTDLSADILQQVKDSTFISLEAIVSQAIEQSVDFVLFSGDIYDLEDRSIKAQLMFQKQMERLNDAAISAFVIHGNHDFVAKKADHLSLPGNVKVFSEQIETLYIETKSNETVAVSGFSYYKKWIEERKIQAYPVKDKKSDYHVGMLHGYAEGQQNVHARYAPFSLSELREKNYDYWALGHIHARQQLTDNPPVYYSGNTQGRHRNETGEKGVLLVSLSPTDKEVSFIPTAPIIWENLRLDVSQAKNLEETLKLTRDKLNMIQFKRVIIHLTLEVSDELPSRTLDKLKQKEFRDILQSGDANQFVYLSRIKVTIRKASDGSNSLSEMYPDGWRKAVDTLKSKEGFKDVTKELLQAPPFSDGLDEPTEDYLSELVDDAVELIEYDISLNEGV
ncbi:MAG: DNA repair exonuclease [Alkalibacterium sp.]|nr:DNA repair exonuclease [Alkalibacterium sp.]